MENSSQPGSPSCSKGQETSTGADLASNGPFEVRLGSWSLNEIFSKNLKLPDYQRAYSWLHGHVRDLLADTFDRKAPYLMGSIILHETSEGCFDIVDGQQRLVTLTVLLHLLSEALGEQPSFPLEKAKFPAGSALHLLKTREIIQMFLRQKTIDEKRAYYEFLLGRSAAKGGGKAWLQFSVLILTGRNALDRAYTFFDSINSKGKPLSDFDLLKAHHLTFVPAEMERLAMSHNDQWQLRDETHGELFSLMLRRLRMWGRNHDRDSRQERPDYNEFLAVVEPEQKEGAEQFFNRYMQPSVFRSWKREGERIVLSMESPVGDTESLLPTQILQAIEGGDAFFRYAKRYHLLYEALFKSGPESASGAVLFIRELARSINNTHLQNAFRAVMLFYADKFTDDRLMAVGICVERIISACRWKSRVRIEGTLTHVCEQGLIPILSSAVTAHHAFTQFQALARIVTPVCEGAPTPTQRGYFDSLKNFYRNAEQAIAAGCPGLDACFYQSL